jgi:hypothetical protein
MVLARINSGDDEVAGSKGYGKFALLIMPQCTARANWPARHGL